MKIFLSLTLASFLSLHLHAQELEVNGARKGVRYSGDVASVVLPAAGLAAILLQEDWQGLKQAAFSTATTLGTTILLKQVIKKQRPDCSDDNSFPSRHAALSFAAATFIQQRYGWQWGLPAYVVSTYVGWTRVYGKKHDWWDVVAGAAIGAGSSFLFTRPFARKNQLTLSPVASSHGYGLYASLLF